MPLLIESLFAVLFGLALVSYVRRRDRLQRDVTLVFAAMAVLFLLDVWRRVAGEPPGWASGAAGVLLLAQPFLTLRLVAAVRRVPRWLYRGAFIAFVVSAAPFAPGRPLPAPLVIVALAVFFLTEAISAVFLFAESRRRSGAPRARLRIAAAGTAALAVSLLVAGAGSADERADMLAAQFAQLVAFAAAFGYLAAFAPPRWLRRWWSTAAGFMVIRRLLEAEPSEPSESIWRRYAEAVREVTGADAAIVLLGDDGQLREVAWAGTTANPERVYSSIGVWDAQPGDRAGVPRPGWALPMVERTGTRYVTAVPLAGRGAGRGVLVVLNTHRRLFEDDDVRLLGGLGAQAGVLAERGMMLAEQERLNRELTVAVHAATRASQAKTDFLASMSHELRTPLNGIIGFTDLMSAEETDVRDGNCLVPAEWIRHMRTSGDHLLSLINDILDLAKVEAGRVDLVPEPVLLAPMVADLIETLRAVVDRKHLHLGTDIPPLVVPADRVRLRQVLYNLLSNAIKFTPDHGRVTITAGQVGPQVHIRVTDTGVGIAAHDQETVFNEFAQVGDVQARRAGTGLGLALTRRLVEAHGGTVRLESEPGRGSQFTVCLPHLDRASHDRAGPTRVEAPC